MKKLEQLFVLGMLCIGMLGLLCISGCGGCSVEMPQCGGVNEDEIRVVGVSIPSCGGCLSSGRGCGSCLWSQAVKLSIGCVEAEVGEGDAEETSTFFLICDNMYYGGCGMSGGACYGGLAAQGAKDWGILLGDYRSGEQKEYYLGVTDGCVGCRTTGPEIRPTIDVMEYYIGID